MTQRIDPGEVGFPSLAVDPRGRLFAWRERLFRAIPAEAAADVRRMFDSGMVGELVEKRLLVPSTLTSCSLDGYAMVIEHERIAPLTYPYEWTFSMLRQAALGVLSVAEIARKHGFQIRDCHGYNVCFDGEQPLYVDLGSFEPVAPGFRGWAAYEEFLSGWFYPLRIWSGGNHFFARRALLGCGLGDRLSHGAYALYRFPWLRGIAPGRLETLLRYWVNGRTLTRNPRKLLSLMRREDFRLRDLQQLQVIDFAALRAAVERMRAPRPGGDWGEYQHSYFDGSGEPRPSPRFDRVAALVAESGARSVVELAGNQGALALRLASLPGIDKVICTDGDADAVDALYRNPRARGGVIAPAVVDFMFPMTNYAGNRPASERLRADAVVALAVTHHLLLAQRLPVEAVLQSIAAYATRFAFVEFMPLGLSDGRRGEPVPSWYTLDWFKEAFGRFFQVQRVEQLEENRVLLVGEAQAGEARHSAQRAAT